MSKTYKDLDVYKISFRLFIETHQFTFNLPKYEMYELGSQIRRSADSVNSNIVEGYGRRYKKDFIKFLVYAHSSNLETVNHLKKIVLLYPNSSNTALSLEKEYDNLGGKLHKFLEYVLKHWKS